MLDDTYRIECPACGRRMTIVEAGGAKSGECPGCGLKAEDWPGGSARPFDLGPPPEDRASAGPDDEMFARLTGPRAAEARQAKIDELYAVIDRAGAVLARIDLDPLDLFTGFQISLIRDILAEATPGEDGDHREKN